MITVWTQAYNTKRYIRQCIESVLAQTYTDFEYLIVDNGSTDGTGEIIDEYASKDSRIRVLREPENYRGIRYSLLLDNINGEYFAALDSDDWLDRDFLERLLEWCEEDNLDMCVCGSMYHHEDFRTEGLLRNPPAKEMFTHSEIPRNFGLIHSFLRTTWGKLVRAKCIRQADLALFKRLVDMQCNGTDTAFTVSVFDACERIGMLNRCMHHYRIRGGSAFHEYDPKRYAAYELLHEQSLNLLARFGPVSEANRRFTNRVFLHAIKDIFGICVDAKLSESDKITEIAEVLSKPRVVETRKADAWDDWRILQPYLEWVLVHKRTAEISNEVLRKILLFAEPLLFETLSERDLGVLLKNDRAAIDIVLGDYRSAYETLVKTAEVDGCPIPSAEEFCIAKSGGDDAEHLAYLLQMGEIHASRQHSVLVHALRIMNRNRLLSCVVLDESVFTFPDVIMAIYKGDLAAAIGRAAELMECRAFEERLQLAALMRYVSAAATDVQAFVYFSKVHAAELLKANLLPQATEALRDLNEMLPHDPEVQELMEYLPPGKKGEQ
jgi:glycosyltransferase involved in cell wall biosynthesis